MDGVFDALIAAAPADVARHGFAYLIVVRSWIFHEECRSLHNLAGLAKAALRDVELAPSLLNRVIAGRVKAFDGGDLAVADVGYGGDAGAHRLLVDDEVARTD